MIYYLIVLNLILLLIMLIQIYKKSIIYLKTNILNLQ